ncbi:MAG: carbon-monoxide dehydrogenase medium subunit [Cellvibrionaceae bacterium]|jgi:carbon-monoxide dehydrogenase medium subunit
MKPAPFAYHAPQTLAQALELIAEHGDDAKLLAGGQSLIPVMNFRLAQPEMLIDLNGTQGLDGLSLAEDGSVMIGSMVRQATLEKSELIKQHVPLVHQTMPSIAHSQIRNRGTIGGSLVHADPAGELPVLMVALQASFELQKVGRTRTVTADEFYIGLFETALEPDEILTKIIIPKKPERTGYAFQEVARRHGDYAMAGVAAVVTCDVNSVCTDARLVFLNVGVIPMQANRAAGMLVGQRLTPELFAKAAEHAAEHEIEPTGDIHASADYRRHLAKVLGKRALIEAFEKLV